MTFTAPARLFWLALLVRLLYMTLAHTWRMRPYNDHFGFGWEMARIARALVTGYGYSDPFSGHTGPTAWVTPAYPLVIAGVFRLFGIYSALSAWVLLALNCVLNALMVRTTFEIAARCFAQVPDRDGRSMGPRIALWSAWLWALYPAAMQYAVKWIWEMTLTAFLFSAVLLLALRMRQIGEATGEAFGEPAADPAPNSIPSQPWTASWTASWTARWTKGWTEGQSWRSWALFGLLWGLIALSNPEVCIMLPVMGVWLLRGAGAAWPRQLPHALLAAVLCLGLIAPWSWRNWEAFHHWVPLRGNFGAELYLGNGPGAVGLLMEYNHPGESPEQLRLYRRLGEVRYVQTRGAAAKQLIRSDWGRFLRLSATRFYYFWFSVPHPSDDAPLVEYGRNLNYQFTSLTGILGLLLACKRRVPAAALFAWSFALLPLLYYFVTVHARFRHPFEPLIVILSVFLFRSAERSRRVRLLSGAARTPVPRAQGH